MHKDELTEEQLRLMAAARPPCSNPDCADLQRQLREAQEQLKRDWEGMKKQAADFTCVLNERDRLRRALLASSYTSLEQARDLVERALRTRGRPARDLLKAALDALERR